MPKTFTLTAISELLPEGEHTGELGYVTFIATDGVDTHKYWTTNTDRLEEDFAQVVPEIEARSIVQQLRRGETVLFPGAWNLDYLFTNRLGGASND
jgi:hypothetical protein